MKDLIHLIPYLQIGFQIGLIGTLILLPWKEWLGEDDVELSKKVRTVKSVKRGEQVKKIGHETGKLLKNCQLIDERSKSNG